MSKLSFEEWVQTYKTEDINADRARGATFLAASGGAFAFNPIAGIIVGPALLGSHMVMTNDFKKSLRKQYKQYLKE